MARKNELARAPEWPTETAKLAIARVKRERVRAVRRGRHTRYPNPAKRCSQAVTETGVVSLRPPGRRI